MMWLMISKHIKAARKTLVKSTPVLFKRLYALPIESNYVGYLIMVKAKSDAVNSCMNELKV